MIVRAIRALVFVAGIAVVLSSCTLMQFINPPQGELRLLRLDMPEVTGEDLPYDIEVTFEADGQPMIKKACFRWMTEREGYSSPPLHCYATEAQDNREIGSVCSRWTTEGPYAQSSPLFCSKIESVKYGNPGMFIVKIQTRNVGNYYNWLECYAEYTTGGELKQSNKIKTHFMVLEPGR